MRFSKVVLGPAAALALIACTQVRTFARGNEPKPLVLVEEPAAELAATAAARRAAETE